MIENVRPRGIVPTDKIASIRNVTTQLSQARPERQLPELLTLVAKLVQAPAPVDTARIAQIRRAIADGTYKIDVEAIASAIIDFHAGH